MDKKSTAGKSGSKPMLSKQKTLLELFTRRDSSSSNVAQSAIAQTPTHVEAANTSSPDVQFQHVPLVNSTRENRSTNLKSKPLHPLFTKKVLVSPQNIIAHEEKIIEILDEDTEESLPQDKGSQYDPIIVDSSPPTNTPVHCREEAKLLQRLFVPGLAKRSILRQVKLPELKQLDASYPTQDSQHVRGPQRTFHCAIRYPLREKSKYIIPLEALYCDPVLHTSKQDSIPSPNATQALPPTLLNLEAYLETIPGEHRQLHPAISHIIDFHDVQKTASSHKPWAEKWHPVRADEVLGNEANAIYLRDWLLALKLQFETAPNSVQLTNRGKGKANEHGRGTKRQRVVRAVDKFRGRKKRRIDSDDEDEDDWIVYDDAEEEFILRDDDDDLHSRSNDHSASNHSFNRLTNTILLTGPPGTGKTAAVYACAQELGWEVFEVYPGIGKRNGASIEHMVGDVGKNHIVRKGKPRNVDVFPSRNTLVTLAEKPGGEAEAERLVEKEGISGIDNDISRSDAETKERTNDIVHQSVILLEEVDILFKDDVNFWPAVIDFIKDCKRPVICTCNDISLIPTRDLPLQTILTFQACPVPVAVSYLQGLCFAEGYSIERASLAQLYESTAKLSPIGFPSHPIPPMSTDSLVPDLRRAIHHLQLRCTSTSDTSQLGRIPQWELEVDSIEDLSDWTWPNFVDETVLGNSSADRVLTNTGMRIEGPSLRESAANHADLISFVDSYLVRSGPEALSLRSCEASDDDEIGYLILYDPVPANKEIGFQNRDEEIASTVIQCSRGILEAGATQEPKSINSFRTHGLFHARVSHQYDIAEVVRNFVPASVWTMARTNVYMEYEPCIRYIVATEDIEEKAYLQRERSGRMTRNSRGSYDRAFTVTLEGREALNRTVLSL